MMRIGMRTLSSVSVWVLLCCLLQVGVVFAQESLKITKDQLEFREEPRAAEENIVGTLRIGTVVEWTGNVSGDWFEVRAPSGQSGWVHKSGLSAPRTPPKQQAKPTPTPAPAAPPETPTPKPEAPRPRALATPNISAEVAKRVAQLEKANAQYKVLLEEKDKRFSDLSAEVKKLEEKLIATSQAADDTKQLQARLAELQKQVDDAVQQKDDTVVALSKEKLDAANQRKNLAALQQQADTRAWERLALYALNIVWLVLLSVIGLFYIRRKRQASPEQTSDAEGVEPGAEPGELAPEQFIPAELNQRLSSGSSEIEETALAQADGREAGEPALVMTASPAQTVRAKEITPEERNIELDEEVIIDLADVVPTRGAEPEIPPKKAATQRIQEIEIVTEEELPTSEFGEEQEFQDAIEVPLEEEHETPIEGEELQDISVAPLLETGEELAEFEELTEVAEPPELVEITPVEEMEELAEVQESEAVEALAEVEELPDIIEATPIEDVEALAEAEELIEGAEPAELVEVTPLEEIPELAEVEELQAVVETAPGEEITEFAPDIIEATPIEDVEELIEVAEPAELVEVTPLEEVEELGEVEELQELVEAPPLEEVEEVAEIEESQAIAEIIPLEDVAEFAEVEELAEVGTFEGERELISAGDFDYDAIYAESPAEVILEEAFEAQAVEEPLAEEFEAIEEVEEINALEEFAAAEDIGMAAAVAAPDALDELDDLEKAAARQDAQAGEGREVFAESEPGKPPAAPLLLEPSQILIEPEHEPAESAAMPPLRKDVEPPPASTPKPARYDIELVQVGEHHDQILRLLSKIEGLTKPPQELVAALPSIIARGAKQTDAQNFQMVMQKLGAEVRLIKKM